MSCDYVLITRNEILIFLHISKGKGADLERKLERTKELSRR